MTEQAFRTEVLRQAVQYLSLPFTVQDFREAIAEAVATVGHRDRLDPSTASEWADAWHLGKLMNDAATMMEGR